MTDDAVMSMRMIFFRWKNEKYLKIFPQRPYFAKLYVFIPNNIVLKIHFTTKIKINLILKVVLPDNLAWIKRNSEKSLDFLRLW